MNSINKSLDIYMTSASFKAESIESPNAWVGHLPFASWIIQQVKPKIFVELGTHTGNSYFAFCQTVDKHALTASCYAVDTWAGDEHAGHYSDDVYTRVDNHNVRKYAHFSKLMRMTFDEALNYFADESIDLLHIDGLHTYEAVKHDFESWLPKLAPGAVVLFHDTQVRERNFGVWKLWQELKEEFAANLEFLHSHGLGILQLNNAGTHQKIDCLAWSPSEQQMLIRYFAALGDRHLLIHDFNEITEALADRDGQLATLNQVVANRDGQLATLNLAVADRDGQLATRNLAVADRDGQLATLNEAVADRDGQLATLNQAVADHDGRIAALEENTAEHCKRAETFELIVKYAERWQRRSWVKRTFHRWRAPNDNRNKIHAFRKLERSIRKRRNQLLRGNYIISKNIIKCTNALKFNYSTQIKSIPFHKSGKPRGWVRLLIFHKNKKPRRTFRRLAYKKSGYPRAVFIAWINHKKIILLDHVSANDSLFKQNNINLQSIAVSISVVIPTYNRANFLKETVQSIIDSAVGLNVEVIVVNDGSSDHTAEVLHQLQIEHPHLRFLTIPNQGAGVARNHGAASAKNDIILFMGDDILPASRDFLAAHSRYHQSHNQNNIGILGKVDWPPDDIFEITPVMRHIQGPGGEQFGYTDMEPHKQWDWRFFYTCNVSVKRHIVDDWLKEGFSPAFTGCGFEDGEFAYRMGKKYGEFPVLYIDESIGHHFHRHTVRSFLQRQHFAGAMAKVLSDLHPDTLAAAGFIAVHEALMTNAPQQPFAIFENLALAESLFSWAKSLEETGILGTESWHKELLHCVFKISAFMGFMDNSGTPTSNHSAASNYVLDSSCIPLMKALPKKNWNAKGFMS